jgi:hypothetical protein
MTSKEIDMAVPKKMTPAQKRMDAKLDKMEPKGADKKKPAASGKKANPFTKKK